ncbi:MAG: DnaJ domain-containing protein [Gammaproteobacteria bacterium]|nr:DnaJ domain-containing protein [Gammaproteobacteria bacterium]
MSRLIILIAIILAIWLLIRWFVRTPPKQVITTAKRAGLVLVLLGLGFLALTGRLNWIFVAGAAALPFLRRGFMFLRFLPMVRGLFGGAAGQAEAAFGQQRSPFSTLETRFLRVSLDTSTGNLDGEVLDGAFEGQFLSKMTLGELLRLLQECSIDPRSAALLAAYLDRHHSGWRAQTDSGGPRETSSEHGMSAAEALDILGLEPNASAEEITQAHRRLIHKLHPDRGGSTYLATKINQAKDYLLKH